MGSSSQNTLADKIRQTKDVTPEKRNLFVHVARYEFGVDGGAIATIQPKQQKGVIPKNAVIVGGTITTTTAIASAGNTISVGTSAGSSATSLLAATANTSFTLGSSQNAAATFAAPVKMSADGFVTLTVATATNTAGVIDIAVYYWVAGN